jgi:hypothetical protein
MALRVAVLDRRGLQFRLLNVTPKRGVVLAMPAGQLKRFQD